MSRTVRVAAACLVALTTTFARAGVASSGGSAAGGNPSVADVLKSVLYGDPSVLEAFLELPFTARSLTNNGAGLTCAPADDSTQAILCRRQKALYRVWKDPFSIKLLAYKWKNAHRLGDDLVFDPCLSDGSGTCPVAFIGEFGLCDRGAPFSPRGGAVDLPYGQDMQCQRWENALFAAQQNNFGYHSLISFNGPTSKADQAPLSPSVPGWHGYVGDQLTSQEQLIRPSRFVKDSAIAVDAVTRTCDATTGETGSVNCGQFPGGIGRCPAGAMMRLRLKPGTNLAGVPLYLSVNQGTHAHDNPFAPGGMCPSVTDPALCPDADFLGATTAPSANPEVDFRCPPGPDSTKLGTFGNQWSNWERLNPHEVAPEFELLIRTATGTFQPYALPSGRPAWPAHENDVFDRENREAVFMANGFTRFTPSADFLKCETRAGVTAALCSPPVCTDPLGCPEPPTRVCDPAFPVCCSPCGRTANDFSSQPNQADYIAGVGGVIDPGEPVLNTTYVLFHNDTGESIRVSNLLVSMNVWVPNAVAVITGVKIGDFRPTPGSSIVQVRVPDRSDVRRTILLPQTSPLCGNNPLVPCPFQIPIEPPLTIDADGFVFIGFVAPGGGADEVQIWGDIKAVNTITTVSGADQWTGIYRIDGSATAGETWIPNSVFDPGSNALTPNGRMKLVVAGSSPSRPLVVFPDTHVWIDKQWGDLDAYARQRICTPDTDTCLAGFEGAINDSPAACLDDSISVDTNTSVPPPPRALKDVGRCSLQNFSGASPAPYVFDDAGDPYPHHAYGVTTFFPNYRNKKDGVVPLDCGSNTVPITPSLSTRTVCVGEYVTLSAAGTVDQDGDALTYSWTEQNSAVSPLSGPRPTFRAPSQATMLTFEMTATDRCQLVGRSRQTVNVWSGNQAPQAFVASHDAVRTGAPVTLDASASLDPEGDPITFAWTQTAGPAVQLSAATTARPSFVAPAPSNQDRVTLTFRVNVTDHPSRSCGVSTTGTADVSVVVLRANQAPTADAGPAQMVNEYSTVTLDGTRSSDLDGDPLTWQWTQIGGTPVQLLAANTARPSFIAPNQPPRARETLTFQLVVADAFNAPSQPATVSVVVQDIYAPPDCSLALASVATLWPPDHRMATVRITNVKERDPEITLSLGITQIRQDEPTTGQGSGDTSVDAVINKDSAQVRAERSGQGDGRVYHLSFTAGDAYGGSCSGTVTVCVPTSSNKACVDGGPLYDSTR